MMLKRLQQTIISRCKEYIAYKVINLHHPLKICLIFGLNEADFFLMMQKTERESLTLRHKKYAHI